MLALALVMAVVVVAATMVAAAVMAFVMVLERPKQTEKSEENLCIVFATGRRRR